LPKIDDLAELKTTLHIFWTLYQRRGYPKFVTYGELLGDKALMKGIGDGEALCQGLERAASRGTLLHLILDREGKKEDLYFLNTEADREAVAKIERGEISLGALPHREPYLETQEPPNIFALYEENIGMLTPMIAEELKEAEKLYPASWIESAFKEAVTRNKRSWRYISRILERWASEGKEYGEPGRESKEDTDKYFKGRYGHLVKRRIE
jgi:DnaD/phage-associated family protein